MRVVTPTDLRARLGEILDAASAGEKILIERDHKPLAVLMSVEEFDKVDAGRRQAEIDRRLKALDELVAFGKRMREKYPPEPGELPAAEWIRRSHEERAEQIARNAARPLAAEAAEPYSTEGEADR